MRKVHAEMKKSESTEGDNASPPTAVEKKQHPSSPKYHKPPGTFTLDLPAEDEVWSSWYVEVADAFPEFASHELAGDGVGGKGTPTRQLSARQISGQFEDEVAKSWEEDWEDEDTEDTYDVIMAKIMAKRAR